jgi:hypothetical protein
MFYGNLPRLNAESCKKRGGNSFIYSSACLDSNYIAACSILPATLFQSPDTILPLRAPVPGALQPSNLLASAAILA